MRMAWWKFRTQSRFPADMVHRLELLGRFEMDPAGSGIDSGEIYPSCIAPFAGDASSDPQGFVADLRAAVADDTGGFATYGASCLVVELLGMNVRTKDALALLDMAIDFKRKRGLPWERLKGYECQRWLEVHGPDTW